MNETHWPSASIALDEMLDIESVKAQTGCNDEDYHELCAVFSHEGNNMILRLKEAEKALLEARDSYAISDAADLLYASAHELSASFGIIGARAAEAYARETQVRVRYKSNRSIHQRIPPQNDLLTATRTLIASIESCLNLLH
jgi:hypothetical protein